MLDVNAWSNVLLAYSASANWVKAEGEMLLGLTNQINSNVLLGTVNGNRSYAIPLGLLSGFSA